MKKRRAGWSLSGAVAFFMLIAVTVTVAMLLYTVVDKRSDGDIRVISPVMFLVILFLSTLCTVGDILRRRKMVDKPVEKILSATERMASGDFSVRIRPTHKYKEYNEFDLIMENLNVMAEELGKSEVMKTDFISNVSHEIKTPLAIIRNYAQLIKTEKDEEKRAKYTEILGAASLRISNLVTNILKLNKLENQRLVAEKERVDLHESLAQAVLFFEEKIEEKNLQIEADLDEICVLSVSGYLEIVWNNLLSNAVKFTDEGGRVALSLKRENKNAVVRIEDTGCGIAPETGKHIFDKFYQGDTSHAQEGNGLGLALVKKVIDLLGGEISVKSELKKGSVFTVTLKDCIIN